MTHSDKLANGVASATTHLGYAISTPEKCRIHRAFGEEIHVHLGAEETAGSQLTHLAPSGFETFFARCAAEFEHPGPPNMERIAQISAEHGIHFLEPRS